MGPFWYTGIGCFYMDWCGFYTSEDLKSALESDPC